VAVVPIEVIRLGDEPRRKCTAVLMAGAPEVRLFRADRLQDFEGEGKWLLAVGGEPLDQVLASGARPRGLVLVDSVWRHTPKVLARLPDMRRVAIPAGWVTAYPRRSKIAEDPASGLATNEAAFIARLLCGIRDPQLLAGYHWRETFLQRNASRIVAALRAVAARRFADSGGEC
jgi:hypothetical protein